MSGRHRSPFPAWEPGSPKSFLQFSERCPAGRRSFLCVPFQSDISVVSNRERFLRNWYISLQNSDIVASFTCCIQQHTVNFAISYKNIAILEVPPHFLGPFLCNLSNYADCIVFRSKFIHFGNAVKSSQITRAIFVRFLSVSLQFTSFFFPFLLLSYLYTTSLVQ